jgi:hypothetical protein
LKFSSHRSPDPITATAQPTTASNSSHPPRQQQQQQQRQAAAAAAAIMAAAQADDFALDWDLPDYPQLPKMFTSAKAAKKRKHKEFILTDADLDTVVKIPKAAAGAAAGTGVPGWGTDLLGLLLVWTALLPAHAARV